MQPILPRLACLVVHVRTVGLPLKLLRYLTFLGASCERKRTCWATGDGVGRAARDDEAMGPAGAARKMLPSGRRPARSMGCRTTGV